jgi:hypothetical protein
MPSVKLKSKRKKAEHAKGWGMRVGGPLPYLAYVFCMRKEDAQKECTEDYHTVVPVRLIMEPKRRAKKRR